MDNDTAREEQTLEAHLQGKYVNIEAMLQAPCGDKSTILYSGTYRGIQRLQATDYIVLENADYYGAAGINWDGDTRLKSERIYVAHDRVISISENRISTQK